MERVTDEISGVQTVMTVLPCAHCTPKAPRDRLLRRLLIISPLHLSISASARPYLVFAPRSLRQFYFGPLFQEHHAAPLFAKHTAIFSTNNREVQFPVSVRLSHVRIAPEPSKNFRSKLILAIGAREPGSMVPHSAPPLLPKAASLG